MRLLAATRNRHKLEEIRTIFNVPGLHLVAADDLPGVPDVVEDRDTFAGNAEKKAAELGRFSGLWTLADDSGLEVEHLDGAPGVWSARYAGEPADYAANNRKLLAALKGVANRRARFRCVVALWTPEDGRVRLAEGRCEGRIAQAEAGAGGFGYDPLFVPEGEARTFAEMSPAEKHRVSHRGRALAAAHAAWGDLLAAAALRAAE